MLYVPFGGQDWAYAPSNVSGTRPATTNLGTGITPGNDTKGAYVQVLTALAQDCYALLICLNSGFTSANARDLILDIGVDPAGGSSYTVLCPDLLMSCSSNWGQSGALYMYFRIFIRAGSTVAARASVHNAAVGAPFVILQAFGQPRDIQSVKCGSYIKSYGVTAASSAGTAVTSGGASEGAWTQLGTVAAGDQPWEWQQGLGINSNNITGGLYHLDLGIGDASNKRVVIQDQPYIVFSTENIANIPVRGGTEAHAAPGDIVYGRMQFSAASNTGESMAAYGTCG